MAQLSRGGSPPAQFYYKDSHTIKPLKVSSSSFPAWNLAQNVQWFWNMVPPALAPQRPSLKAFLMHFGFILISCNSLPVSFNGSPSTTVIYRSPICLFITCLLEFSAFGIGGTQWPFHFINEDAALSSFYLNCFLHWEHGLVDACWQIDVKVAGDTQI